MVEKVSYPLQLMRDPMAPDSRQLKPVPKAAAPHAKNLAEKATTQMRMVYPQVIPLSSKPRLVLSPERVKYYADMRPS